MKVLSVCENLWIFNGLIPVLLWQNLKDQLLSMTKERDKLMIQIGEQQNHVVEVEFLKKHCNEMVGSKVFLLFVVQLVWE